VLWSATEMKERTIEAKLAIKDERVKKETGVGRHRLAKKREPRTSCRRSGLAMQKRSAIQVTSTLEKREKYLGRIDATVGRLGADGDRISQVGRGRGPLTQKTRALEHDHHHQEQIPASSE